MPNASASGSGAPKTIQTPWGPILKGGSGSSKSKLGMVELQMSFDYNANILYVTIIQGKNLRTGSDNVKPDAFVMGYLLPYR